MSMINLALAFQNICSNVSPRIVRGTTSGYQYGPGQNAFLNIELLTEKRADYWYAAIRQLKQDFPTKRIVASITSPFREETWSQLAAESERAGADMIELNLSCPHGIGERGMGIACGQDPLLVTQVCKWIRAAVKIPVGIDKFVWRCFCNRFSETVLCQTDAERHGYCGHCASGERGRC